MDERIELLEREVVAIKSEIAVLKSNYWTREDARAFATRLASVENDIAQIKIDFAQLKIDFAQLKTDVAQLKIDVAQVKTELTHLATKEALHESEARLKTWMITMAISLISVISGIQFALYAALRH